MSEQIKRYISGIERSGPLDSHARAVMYEFKDGRFVLHSDHIADKEAARTEDKAEIERLRTQIKKYRARLEIDHDWIGDEFGHFTCVERNDDLPIDGIECRDETIKQLDTRIAELEAKVKQTDSLFNDAEAVRRDAERYRHLCATAPEILGYADFDEAIDAAIDAAREKK